MTIPASRWVVALSAATTLAAAGAVVALPAAAKPERAEPTYLRHSGTLFLQANLPSGRKGEATSAEIIGFADGGTQLLYTDALSRRLGFIDSSEPGNPRPVGSIDLPGDPTSVAVVGKRALVAIVTSSDPDGDGPLTEHDAPSGELLVVDLETREVRRTIPLSGQPDSVAVAPSKRYAAIVIENERDEDENDGFIPQPPAGLVQVLDLRGENRWRLRNVDLTGFAETAPQDPEPEYVDINVRDRAVVTLQENNHLAIINLERAKVVRDFSAGTTDVANVDTVEEELGPQGAGVITLEGSLTDRRREPDTVQWIDRDTFVTANEGDYTDGDGVEGGTRSFTLFNSDGTVEYEAGNTLEHQIVRAGHYPESRSENKGSEPEGLEVATYRGRTYLFVAAERANVVGVYEIVNGRPRFRQLLPTGIGPEGLVFRNGVLAVSAEADGLDEGFSARPFITFFEMGAARPTYPDLVSGKDAKGLPIPWVAQSGLSGDAQDEGTMWSVSDSVLGQAYMYRIDVASLPAVITERIPVGDHDVVDQGTGDFDLEGIAARPEGGFWLASEGRTNIGSSRPNLIVRVDDAGNVLESVELPVDLVAGATSSGLEGVAVTGSQSERDETVYVAIQREWADDPAGFTKIGRYDVASGQWTFASYPLDTAGAVEGAWVGLSELTLLPDGALAIVERDNQLGLEARVKRIYRIDPSSVEFAPFGESLPTFEKTLLADILPQLDRASISVPDKVEGLGITTDGRAYAVTDNDGVDENYGETVLIRLGRFITADG